MPRHRTTNHDECWCQMGRLENFVKTVPVIDENYWAERVAYDTGVRDGAEEAYNDGFVAGRAATIRYFVYGALCATLVVSLAYYLALHG